jgi:hypothetical protein
LEDLEARGDPIMREVLRREGRLIAASVLRQQDRWLILSTTQPILRLRSGTRLTSQDGRISAVVVTLHARTDTTFLLVRVTRGIRAASALQQGSSQDWMDTAVFRGRFISGADATWFADIPAAQALAPLPVPADLPAFARRLRQP